MHTLREWREKAEERGFTRIAELSDYLQADERTHVRLATDWIRALTEEDPVKRDDLVHWGREAIARIQNFNARRNGEIVTKTAGADARFTFQKPGDASLVGVTAEVAGD
ncbi:MAG TPA: hypothetical protein VER37_06290, partial [Thermomicrobiales bacterium]|nr:hypothetical protein [Thermomicrobiales bacterium]